MIPFVERHRKIPKCQICIPIRNYCVLVAIDYRDVAGIGNIDEDSLTALLQLKGFGMCREFDRTDLLSVHCVDDSDASAAKPDVNLLGALVVTNIVGIIFEIQFSNDLKRFSIVNLANPSFVLSNKQTIHVRGITESLRCSETRDGVNALARSQIEYFDRVIAERTNKQPFPGRIEREMVETSFDTC